MNTTTKLLTGTALAAAFLTACSGTNLPTGTDTLGKPGFTVRVTKNNTPVADRYVWLKKFTGSEGTLVGGSAVPGTEVKTDSNGQAFIPAPADAVGGGGLFGVAYDATNTTFHGDAEKGNGAKNTDEIQWFSTPAINLATKPTKTAAVNFDIGWAASGFTPANGDSVPAGDVTFTLAPRAGAKSYEVAIVKGNVAGSGTAVKTVSSPTNSLKWTGAEAGQYNYQAKALSDAGIAGITGDSQTAAPSLVFTVTGKQ